MKTIYDLFKQSKQEWLENARDTARGIGSTKRVFTIEDVLLACPLPKYLHHNTIGNVFKHEDFKAVGYAPSVRSISHGRTIRTWTLAVQPNDLQHRLWRYNASHPVTVE